MRAPLNGLTMNKCAVAGLASAARPLAMWSVTSCELAGPLLGATLAGLRFRVLDGGCGGALYRSLQARFEHEAAVLLPSPRLCRAALICDELADAWRAFGAAAGDDDSRRAHAACATWLARIQALEHRHVEELEQHLAGRPRR